MGRREFVQLAQQLDLKKHKLAGSIWTPKLDGMRAIWDGGITAGMNVNDVPWANVERDKKLKLATGLWSRLGKPIQAHPDFLKILPQGMMLDGELYLGKDALEDTMAVKCDVPEWSFWKDVSYQVFDTPSLNFFNDGDVVYDANTRKQVNFGTFAPSIYVARTCLYGERMAWLRDRLIQNSQLKLVDWARLSQVESEAKGQLWDAFDSYVNAGGEGLMLRLPTDVWVPNRVKTLLKFKPKREDVATVVGYISAEIGKTGRMVGMLGSVEVVWNEKTFTLSGFTNEERLLPGKLPSGMTAVDYAFRHTGERLPSGYSMPKFPIGSKIPFKYTSLTQDGVPREARYDRPEL